MDIPFNAPLRQYEALRGEIDAAVARVLASGRYLMAAETTAFEEAFAEYCGAPHCVTVANGTDALELALRAAGCTAGTEVVTVPNAGGYATCACVLVGAVPVYVDVVPDTLLMDLDAAVAAVTERTACIVATHLYGHAVDVAGLRRRLRAAGHAGVTVLEDCAQAHGARTEAGRVGGLGDLAAVSFYPTKNLGALGDGGAVLCRDEARARAVRRLKQYGWDRKYHSAVPYGRNSRMDEVQAAVLLAKLPHLERFNRRRRAIVEAYRAAAPKGIVVPGRDDPSCVGHLAVALADERDGIRQALAEGGVPTDVHYPVLDPDQPAMRAGDPSAPVAYVRHGLAAAERAARRVFSLPCFPELTDREVDHICGRLARL